MSSSLALGLVLRSDLDLDLGPSPPFLDLKPKLLDFLDFLHLSGHTLKLSVMGFGVCLKPFVEVEKMVRVSLRSRSWNGFQIEE